MVSVRVRADHQDSQLMITIEDWLAITWLAKMIDVLDAATISLITILIIYFLQRGRTGFRRTESMINRLILWTISTGLLTCICAIITLIFVRVLGLLLND